jgi:hypothetical protein
MTLKKYKMENESNKQTAYKINQGDYLIYQDGRLFNEKTKKFKKWSKDANGYIRCTIWNSNMPITVSQHRLLAEMFIPNPLNKLQVNHINGIKHDNRIDNLEWVTQSENSLHSFANGLQKVTRPCKKVIDTSNNKIYESVTEAAKDNTISRSYLSNMLTSKNNNKTTLKLYGK